MRRSPRWTPLERCCHGSASSTHPETGQWHSPKRNDKVIPLEHPQLKVSIRVFQIPNPRPPLTPLRDRLLRRPPRILDPIDRLPDAPERAAIPLQTHPLDGHCALVLGPAHGEVFVVAPQRAGEVAQSIERLAIGFLEGEVDVRGKSLLGYNKRYQRVLSPGCSEVLPDERNEKSGDRHDVPLCCCFSRLG